MPDREAYPGLVKCLHCPLIFGLNLALDWDAQLGWGCPMCRNKGDGAPWYQSEISRESFEWQRAKFLQERGHAG